jgi:hypothetical protein
MAKKSKVTLPSEEGILWKPKKDPAKKRTIDPITGKRANRYGKMPRIIKFHETTPEGWDNRSWRLQIFSFLEKAAANMDTTPRHLLANAGYNTSANIAWLTAMKKDHPQYHRTNLEMLSRIARLTNTPFTLQ